MSVKI